MNDTVVYLDICALKRPFDDGRDERNRREAEAVARIFEQVESGTIQLVKKRARVLAALGFGALTPDRLPLEEEHP